MSRTRRSRSFQLLDHRYHQKLNEISVATSHHTVKSLFNPCFSCPLALHILIKTSTLVSTDFCVAFLTLASQILERITGTKVESAPTVIENKKIEPKKTVDDDGSDDEVFDEEDLNADLEKLMTEKAKIEKRICDVKTGKKHAKTDVNVFNLDLSSLEKEADLATGDPAICNHCGVIFSSQSKIVNMKKKELETYFKENPRQKSMILAPPLTEKFMYLVEKPQGKNAMNFNNIKRNKFQRRVVEICFFLCC